MRVFILVGIGVDGVGSRFERAARCVMRDGFDGNGFGEFC